MYIVNKYRLKQHQIARVVDVYQDGKSHPEYREGFRDALGVTRKQVEDEMDRRAYVEEYTAAFGEAPHYKKIEAFMQGDDASRREVISDLLRRT